MCLRRVCGDDDGDGRDCGTAPNTPASSSVCVWVCVFASLGVGVCGDDGGDVRAVLNTTPASSSV